MTGISVLTIAAGRAAHLANLLRGLARQTCQPDEFIIARMQDAPYDDLPDTPFPVRQIAVTAPELPLARARNAAAAQARGDLLIFLDVDCIPGPTLVADYAEAARGFDGLLMGEVMYLPEGAATGDWDYPAFESVCERHSDRQAPPAEGLAPCEDYRCFWSLNFALKAAAWQASGGFDERYRGYGGEDTDFGRTLDAQGIPIAWMKGARVYHQYHPHHMPPVHHLRSVIRNAELFGQKWGYRTMEHWLYAFRLMGLIEDTPEGIRILREPTEADRALTMQSSDRPYVNTRRVIDRLKAQTGGGDPRDEEAALLRPAESAGQKGPALPGLAAE